jgi:hypothetical protein
MDRKKSEYLFIYFYTFWYADIFCLSTFQKGGWERISSYRFEAPGSPDGYFTAKLAANLGRHRKIAPHIVNEYKKFLFIAATCGHQVSPSQLVDEVSF